MPNSEKTHTQKNGRGERAKGKRRSVFRERDCSYLSFSDLMLYIVFNSKSAHLKIYYEIFPQCNQSCYEDAPLKLACRDETSVGISVVNVAFK